MSTNSKASHFYTDLISHAFPCLLIIAISGIIDIEVALNHPLDDIFNQLFENPDTQMIAKRISWNLLQILPSFAFGIISDRDLRKKTFLYSQLIGIAGSLLLLLFDFQFWVFILIGLTFNPLSVSRAAMLDNYPKFSALKIIAITFMVKNAAWLFIDAFANIPLQSVISWILPIQLLNAIIIYKFFRDEFDKKPKNQEQKNNIKINKKPIILTLVAFAFSETTFYLLWNFLETKEELEKWLLITTAATYLGTFFTLLYKKIPHPSLIAILYASGAGMMLITLLYSHHFNLSYTTNLIAAMSHFCIIGGMYLPFVADSIIELSGTVRKATGSAIFEIGDMAALFLASLISISVVSSPLLILMVNIGLYGIALSLQKTAEIFNKQCSTN